MAQPALSINGSLSPLDGAHLNARDRGFLLGDGIFETIRIRATRPLRWHRHLRRLHAGAAVLGLPLPWSDEELEGIVAETAAAGELTEAVIRLTVSRGVSQGRGLVPDAMATPTLVVHAAPFGGYPAENYEQGMRAITSTVRRNDGSPASGIKSLNYLDPILARREAAEQGADEALMLNTVGNLAGASAANLFLVSEGRILTPTVRCGALPGTVRGAILDLLPRDAAERQLSPADLARCTEAFLTNALMGVMPLTMVDGKPIGGGRPGPVTARAAATIEQAE